MRKTTQQEMRRLGVNVDAETARLVRIKAAKDDETIAGWLRQRIAELVDDEAESRHAQVS